MPYNFNIFNMLCTHCNFYISIINIHTKRNSHVLQSGLTISAYISLSFVVSFSFRRSLFRTFFVFVALVLLNFSPMPTDLYAMDFWFSIQHAYIIYILYINKFSQKKKQTSQTLFIYLLVLILAFFTHDTYTFLLHSKVRLETNLRSFELHFVRLQRKRLQRWTVFDKTVTIDEIYEKRCNNNVYISIKQ